MADRLWIGGSSGVWTLAANWSPATVPVAADDVYITGGSANIDSIDQNTIALGRLVVGTGYSGSIGSGGALHIDAASLDYSGQGSTANFKGTYTTVTVQDTSTSETALKLDGSSDTIATVRILGGKGTVTLAADCEITGTIEQIGASGVTTIVSNGITLTTVDVLCDSGKLQLNEPPTNLTVFGGDVDALLDTGTITAVDIYGGRLRWSPTAACTITTLTVYSGTFDSRNSSTPQFTVTNATVHEAGIIDERSGLANASWASPVQMEGGRLMFDIGRTVTLA
tara:strand:+ start:9777 stop:10622 length:846 start_codon:yes stop_codon:yes gene_type:complete